MSDIANVWKNAAPTLAEWAFSQLVNRTDRYGVYDEEGPKNFPKSGTVPGALTVQRLTQHFAGTAREHTVGLHSLGTDSMGRWAAWDIDAHDGQPCDPAANERYAKFLYAKLTALGFLVLLYSSNGKGGYHAWVLFDQPVPGDLLHSFAVWAVSDCKDFGVADVEANPKQKAITEDTPFGNWLRLPGRHYKRDYWPQAWNGSGWMSPAETVEYMFQLFGQDPALIPAAAYPEPEPEPQPQRSASASQASSDDEKPWVHFNRNADWRQIIAEAGGEFVGANRVRRPGKEGGWSGTLGNKKDPESGCDKLYLFTNAWPGLPKTRRYLTPFDFESLRRYGRVDGETNSRLIEALRNEGRIPPRQEGPEMYFGNLHVNGKRFGEQNGKHNANGKQEPKSNSGESRDGFCGKPLELPQTTQTCEFPLDIFPRPVADYWESAARSLNVPVDYIGVLGLGMLGAAVGRGYVAEVKPGWRDAPLFWVGLVAPPGGVKSESLNKAAGPLNDIQAEWAQQHAEEMRRYAVELNRHEVEMKDWKAGGCGEDDPTPPEKPVMRQLAFRDWTTESLVLGNIAYPKGVAVVQDELAGLVLALNQYRSGGKGNDKQHLLSFWSGSSITKNRAGRQEKGEPPLHLDKSFLAVVGVVQPDLLSMFRGDVRAHSVANDGWADRWLMAYPDPYEAAAETWATIPGEHQAGYEAVFRALLDLGAVPETDEHGEVIGVSYETHVGPFDQSARVAWEGFTGRIAERMNKLEVTDPYRGLLSKQKTYCVRFSALLQALRIATGQAEPHDPIPGTVVTDAEKLVEYFDSHSRRCFGVGTHDARSRIARRLLNWLARKPDIKDFTKTKAFQQLKDNHITSTADLIPALGWLTDYGYLAPLGRPESTRSGPVAEAYTVNPAWDRCLSSLARFSDITARPVPKVPTVERESDEPASNSGESGETLCGKSEKLGQTRQTRRPTSQGPTPVIQRPTSARTQGRRTWRDDLLDQLERERGKTVAELADDLAAKRNARPKAQTIRGALDAWCRRGIVACYDESKPYRYVRVSDPTEDRPDDDD